MVVWERGRDLAKLRLAYWSAVPYIELNRVQYLNRSGLPSPLGSQLMPHGDWDARFGLDILPVLLTRFAGPFSHNAVTDFVVAADQLVFHNLKDEWRF